jgi:hypothetical protein
MILISNYSNFLTVSTAKIGRSKKQEVKEKTIRLDPEILTNSKILKPKEYIEALVKTFKEMKINYKIEPVVFLIDPSLVEFKFIKNIKDGNDLEIIKENLSEMKISEDDVYYSTQKRTPLFSQLVVIKRDYFDDILEICEKLNIDLIGIFSYMSLLSRFQDLDDGGAVISSYLGKIVLMFTKFGGIYFNKILGSFENSQNVEKLKSSINEYVENGNIKKVASFNFETPETSSNLQISEIEIPNSSLYQNPVHALGSYVLENNNSEIFTSNFNLLNLVDVAHAPNRGQIWIKVTISAVFLLVTSIGSYSFFVSPEPIKEVLSSFTSGNIEKPISDEIIGSIQKSLDNPIDNKVSQIVTTEPDSVSSPSDLKNIDLSAPMNTKDLDKKKLKVQILNATGKSGIAGRNAELLKTTLGYPNVVVGNSSDKVTGTVIRVKEELLMYKEAFSKEFLTFKDLKFEEEKNFLAPYDMVIILGN